MNDGEIPSYVRLRVTEGVERGAEVNKARDDGRTRFQSLVGMACGRLSMAQSRSCCGSRTSLPFFFGTNRGVRDYWC